MHMLLADLLHKSYLLLQLAHHPIHLMIFLFAIFLMIVVLFPLLYLYIRLRDNLNAYICWPTPNTDLLLLLDQNSLSCSIALTGIMNEKIDITVKLIF